MTLTPDIAGHTQTKLRIMGDESVDAPSPVVVLLSCYMTGSTEGRNLGIAGYSHDFVARAFVPLLERYGEVRAVVDPRRNLQAEVDQVIAERRRPLHFSVLPLQDVILGERVTTIAVPAWEFPDVPNEGFDGNPQNDWGATADRCDLVLVSGPFTEGALLRSGTKTAIGIVPVPVDDAYFAIPSWKPKQRVTLECRAFVFEPNEDSQVACSEPLRTRDDPSTSIEGQGFANVGKRIERAVRAAIRSGLGDGIGDSLSRKFRRARERYRLRQLQRRQRKLSLSRLPYPHADRVDLSGIVYTSIFNPDDGRKNWSDLITGFLAAVGDRADATLVVKLITQKPDSVRRVIDFYRGRDTRHRCRIVFICDFLTAAQLLDLTTATTFYLQATKAEGNCLPLMNHLAAGRPGVSPDHSSVGDYFDARSGFVVASHPEPSAWPHDRRLRQRTTWARIVWPSLRDQIRESYRMARGSSSAYNQLSRRCRIRMRAWAGKEAVAQSLDQTVGRLLAGVTAGRRAGQAADQEALLQKMA